MAVLDCAVDVCGLWLVVLHGRVGPCSHVGAFTCDPCASCVTSVPWCVCVCVFFLCRGTTTDVLPEAFMTSGGGAFNAGDLPIESGKMRSAIMALRHVLRHPMTDTNDDTQKAYTKTTASMKVT